MVYLGKLIYLKNMVHESKVFIKTKIKTISSFIRLRPTSLIEEKASKYIKAHVLFTV